MNKVTPLPFKTAKHPNNLSALKYSVLWRASEKGSEYHYALRPGEKEVSLFGFDGKARTNTGHDFLVFMFCAPFKRAFLDDRKRQSLQKKTSVSLDVKRLKLRLKSSPGVGKKFAAIAISEKQQEYDINIKHCEIVFSKKEDCWDPAVKGVLMQCSTLNPKNQDENFMQQVVQESCQRLGI